ncbi:fluoride efflux transporter CrcB [Bacillus sinesaloumensis]|uniref:fluoride efflux transporter CrcB n=1 Tax=Litchfieldia sinesaloumensis TaxID=1926280 RepID=UPI0009888E8C|nr:fluoride efflux transporter CrcB [Bacillus sinesaloumensis]
MKILFVMLGGFFGAISRYLLGVWIIMPTGFPIGTLTVNLIGCFILGWLLTFIATLRKVNPMITLFFGTGFLGSFTTFSTFSVEVIQLIEDQKIGYAALYMMLSLFVGLILSYIGYRVAITRKLGEKS